MNRLFAALVAAFALAFAAPAVTSNANAADTMATEDAGATTKPEAAMDAAMTDKAAAGEEAAPAKKKHSKHAHKKAHHTKGSESAKKKHKHNNAKGATGDTAPAAAQ